MDFSLPSYSKVSDPTASVENVPELTNTEVKQQARAPKKKKSTDEKSGVSLSTVLPSLDKKSIKKERVQEPPVAAEKEEVKSYDSAKSKICATSHFSTVANHTVSMKIASVVSGAMFAVTTSAFAPKANVAFRNGTRRAFSRSTVSMMAGNPKGTFDQI